MRENSPDDVADKRSDSYERPRRRVQNAGERPDRARVHEDKARAARPGEAAQEQRVRGRRSGRRSRRDVRVCDAARAEREEIARAGRRLDEREGDERRARRRA